MDRAATAPASDGLHSGCTGDEARRPARSCRQREANPTRESPAGHRKDAGRVALAIWITPQGRWALRARFLCVSLRASHRDWHAGSNRRDIDGRPTEGHPAFSAHGRLRNTHTARSATLDHRRRLFGPETPLKMGRSEEHTSELQSLTKLVCRL